MTVIMSYLFIYSFVYLLFLFSFIHSFMCLFIFGLSVFHFPFPFIERYSIQSTLGENSLIERTKRTPT